MSDDLIDRILNELVTQLRKFNLKEEEIVSLKAIILLDPSNLFINLDFLFFYFYLITRLINSVYHDNNYIPCPPYIIFIKKRSPSAKVFFPTCLSKTTFNDRITPIKRFLEIEQISAEVGFFCKLFVDSNKLFIISAIVFD